MFDDIGGKIKKLATFFSFIGIIISILVGIILTVIFNSVLFLLLIGGLGSLFSWIASFCLYGFGQLIENSDKAVELLSKNNTINKTNEHVNNSTPTNPPKSNNNYEDKSLEETIPDVF